jgi:hypothetical protein
MATVSPNDTIIKLLSEKDKSIRNGTKAILDLLNEYKNVVQTEIAKAGLSDWSQYRLQQMLASLETAKERLASEMSDTLKQNIFSASKQGEQIVVQPLNVSGVVNTGQFGIGQETLRAMAEYSPYKIKSVTDDMFNQIRAELINGVLSGKTPYQVALAVGKSLDSAGIFSTIARRAEVITGLEMGTIFSTATQLRMETAGQYVKGLKKEWRHAGHPKTPRPDHLAAHGRRVDHDKPFGIYDKKRYNLMYPRDPKAGIDARIQCGCDSFPWMEGWGEDAVIPKEPPVQRKVILPYKEYKKQLEVASKQRGDKPQNVKVDSDEVLAKFIIPD